MGQDNLRGAWKGGVMNFRDDRYSPVEGKSVWENCPSLIGVNDPAGIFEDFDDAFRYVAADWTITTVGAGTATTLANAAGGAYTLTTDANVNDRQEMQKLGLSFLPATGKPLWFEARLQADNATLSDIFIGLAPTDTTIIAGVTDGIFFLKASGVATAVFSAAKASAQTNIAAVATIVAATNIRLGFFYDGAGTVTPYVDGVAGTAITSANIPTGVPLRLSMGVRASSTAARSITVDYIACAQVR